MIGSHELGIIALAFVANIGYIGLRALQQRNVIHENYIAIHITSMFMAVGDWFNPDLVAIYTLEARNTGDWTMPIGVMLAWGIGGGIGSRLAIKFHKMFNGVTK